MDAAVTPAPPVPVTRPGRLGGAVAAVIAGVASMAATRVIDVAGPLGALPPLQLLGVGVAVLYGAWLAPAAQQAKRPGAVVLGLAYGAIVPATVAAVLTIAAPPIVPIAVAVSVVAWPLTMPAALAWLALVR